MREITEEQRKMWDEVLEEERTEPPMSPGEVLKLEFLEPLDISQYALAKAIGVRPPRVYEIVSGKRAITADTAIRLEEALGMPARMWLGLQNEYALQVAELKEGQRIRSSVKRLVRA